MRTISLLTALVLAPALAGAQAPDTATCRTDLDGLKQKTEADYAGYTLEVRDSAQRRAGYDSLVAALRVRADTTPAAHCFPVLDAFARWFADPHLFIFQNTQLDTAESRRRQASVERLPIDEADARRIISADRRPDPIEGIWYEGRLRVAVVRDSSGPGSFVAVVLAPDTAAWTAGSVRARFQRLGPDRYSSTVWSLNYAVRTLDVTLHKRVLLRLSPGLWGKVWPVSPADSGLLDTVDVHRPTLVVRGGTVIVSLTSHDPANAPLLGTLLARHAEDLRRADRLIIDLRGNEGGSSWVSNGLLPYIASRPPRPAAPDTDRAVMLVSPDQVRYASRSFGDTTSAFVRSLLARMRAAAPGTFVPLQDPSGPPDPATPDSVLPWPARVAVLVDGGTVSAAEVLVLKALRSTRARVYGLPTEGALDYQSASIVRLAPGENRWYLGYPTITAHTRLPAGGMRGKGIAPDVRVDWSGERDAIAAVERLMR